MNAQVQAKYGCHITVVNRVLHQFPNTQNKFHEEKDAKMIIYMTRSNHLASCPGFFCFKTMVDVAIV